MKNQKGSTSVIVSFIIVVGIIILVIYALTHKAAPAENVPVREQSTTNQTEVNNKTSTSTKPMQQQSNKRTLENFTPVAHAAALQKQDLKVGTGTEVKAGDTVSVHYTGAIAATGEVFQSSKDFGPTPITFPLSGVIKGWTDGIPGMKIGGIRRLVIPAALAYGATPPPGSGIPANADLVFDVELVGIK